MALNAKIEGLWIFWRFRAATQVYIIYLCKKNCSVYIQCKDDIVVVDIKQHKLQFKNSNITITQSTKFF